VGDWETGRLGRLEEFVSGGRGDWEARRLGDCETGRKKMNSLTYLLTFNFLPLLITHHSSLITHHYSTPKLFNYSTIIICPQ